MKTLIAAVGFATLLAAPAFAQYENAWKWKGSPYAASYAAPASATSACAASFKGLRRAVATFAGNYGKPNMSPASLFVFGIMTTDRTHDRASRPCASAAARSRWSRCPTRAMRRGSRAP